MSNYQPGNRVRVLHPIFNSAIWGFTGTILDQHQDQGRGGPYWNVRLDTPNPRHLRDPWHIRIRETEIELLDPISTTHTRWDRQ